MRYDTHSGTRSCQEDPELEYLLVRCTARVLLQSVQTSIGTRIPRDNDSRYTLPIRCQSIKTQVRYHAKRIKNQNGSYRMLMRMLGMRLRGTVTPRGRKSIQCLHLSRVIAVEKYPRTTWEECRWRCGETTYRMIQLSWRASSSIAPIHRDFLSKTCHNTSKATDK